MGLQVAKRLITVEEFHRMADAGILNEDDNVELINGELITMTPIGSRHASVVDKISNQFRNLVQEQQAIIRVQNPVQIGDLSEPEPDVALLKYQENFYKDHHPLPEDIFLIIEVGETSLEFDREIKLPLYAKGGIPEVWLVDIQNNLVEVYQVPSGNLYKLKKIYQPEDQLEITSLNLQFSVQNIMV